jgi:hypothetical protein
MDQHSTYIGYSTVPWLWNPFLNLPIIKLYLCRRVIEIFDDDGNGEVDFKEFIQVNNKPPRQGVIKTCRLSWLTNSALFYESKCGERGGVAGSQSMRTGVQCTMHMEPKYTLDI